LVDNYTCGDIPYSLIKDFPDLGINKFGRGDYMAFDSLGKNEAVLCN
jgi:hypothetical protein